MNYKGKFTAPTYFILAIYIPTYCKSCIIQKEIQVFPNSAVQNWTPDSIFIHHQSAYCSYSWHGIFFKLSAPSFPWHTYILQNNAIEHFLFNRTHLSHMSPIFPLWIIAWLLNDHHVAKQKQWNDTRLTRLALPSLYFNVLDKTK